MLRFTSRISPLMNRGAQTLVCMMHVCYCHNAAASVLKARVRVVGPRLGGLKLMIFSKWGWFGQK